MNQLDRVTPTPVQEQAAFAWLSLLHDQPSSGDQATFSHWLQADPAHAEAYAQAQVVWELSEVPARTLANEDAFALQGYLNAMNQSRRSSVRRWSGALAMAACLLLMISLGSGWQPMRWVDDLGADYVSAPGEPSRWQINRRSPWMPTAPSPWISVAASATFGCVAALVFSV